jgi:hypothetical protein
MHAAYPWNMLNWNSVCVSRLSVCPIVPPKPRVVEVVSTVILLLERELDGYRGSFPVVKRPGREAGYSPSSTKVENDRSLTPPPPCAYLYGVFRDVAVPFVKSLWSLHCTKLKANMVCCPFVKHTNCADVRLQNVYTWHLFTRNRNVLIFESV